jgi:D,D-heptose 1,7-bisphosphate phosphatase|tara:strand:- start:931 stop:1443 length:513 start_codon:yes stop_codon:yes gene_type:complete
MKLKKKYKAAFLDRDGVINFDKGYINNFSNITLRKGVVKGLQELSKKKYLIFIITNQAGVAKGFITYEDLLKLNKQFIKFFKKRNIKITKIEFCPHHHKGIVKKYKKKCNCRKPGNLMIKRIFKNWKIDKKSSFMIGDRLKDKQTALKSGLLFEYALPNFKKQIKDLIKT